jgi:hypothetical protein
LVSSSAAWSVALLGALLGAWSLVRTAVRVWMVEWS